MTDNNLIKSWIEWNEKRMEAKDFCSIFGEKFSTEITKAISKRTRLEMRKLRNCENCNKILEGNRTYFCDRSCSALGKRKRRAAEAVFK